MNDSTPHSEAHETHGSSDTPPQDGAGARPTSKGSAGFFAWFRGLGIVRGNERWFAGVAGGIAAKAGIDPLIIRGLFVVLALLGGPGILLYLAGWLLLPDHSGRIHLEDVFRGRASGGVITTVVILGVLLLLPLIFRVLPSMFMMPWAWDVWESVPGLGWVGTTFTVIWWALIFPALIIWLIVWLARRSRAETSESQHAAEGPRAAPSNESWEDRASQFGAQAAAWGERVGRESAEWGEKVGRETSEWARAAGAAYQAQRLGAAHVVLTLAVALLAGGAAASWAISQSADINLTLTAGLLGVVTVLALSLIIAGIRGRHGGWISFLSVIGVIALAVAPFTSLLPSQVRFVPVGNTTLTAEDHEPDNAIVMLAGNTTVDLTQLSEDADGRDIDVWVLAGNNTIQLSDTHPTTVEASVLAGNIISEGEPRISRDREAPRESGLFLHHRTGSELAGARDSDVVNVHIRLMFGRVIIEGADGSGTSVSGASSQQRSTIENQFASLEVAS